MKSSLLSRVRANKTACFAALAAGLATGGPATAIAQVLPPKPDPTCVVPDSEFKTWFKTQPGLNQPVKEADSVALNTSNNCNFYKWSTQMFLWLTSRATGAYGGNRVLDSKVFYQIDNNGNLIPQRSFGPLNLALRAAQAGPDGLPVVIDAQGRLREFVTAPSKSGQTLRSTVGGEGPSEIATVKPGADGKAIFLDSKGQLGAAFTPRVTAAMLPEKLGRLAHLAAPQAGAAVQGATAVRDEIANVLTAKKVLIKFDTAGGPVFIEAGSSIITNLGPGQAGGNGVLISQQNSVIFYEVLVNDVYAWYLTGRKTPGGIAPLYNGNVTSSFGVFPTSQTDLTSIVAFAKSHGGPPTFLDGKALAVEVKLSWVEATSLPNGGNGYITARALVPVYNTSNPTSWTPAGSRLTTVALVGAHIVGSANGHPEMVWATFEHQANTPLATYQYTSGGKTITVAQNTSGSWLFSASGASAPFNTELAYLTSSGTIASTTAAPIGRSNILRMKAWGVASNGVPNQEDKTPPAATTQILSLNTDVRAKLVAAGASADPRLNYLLVGATWTLGGGQPNGAYPQNPAVNDVIGTSMLENSTMETFQQGSNPTYQTGLTCFSCHAAAGSNPKVKADTSVSHYFGGINPLPTAAQSQEK